MKYPPVKVLFTVQMASKSEAALVEAADRLAAHITPQADEEKVQMIGPVDASVYKINDIYRKILYLKQENYDILIKIRDNIDCFQQEKSEIFKGVVVQYDFS